MFCRPPSSICYLAPAPSHIRHLSMQPFFRQSLPLFRIRGINVRIHWTWFLWAWFRLANRGEGVYSSITWNIAEFLGLFLIILMHEFGHALATRQVGGQAENIVLWPFGGIAFVDAPPRAAAQLWGIAAGPLVNVALLVVLPGLRGLLFDSGLADRMPLDVPVLLSQLIFINKVILIFNILPVYPLDGGQILRSLMWFGLGERRSLAVASAIGLVGAAGLGAYAYWRFQSFYTLFMAYFLGTQSWRAWQFARRPAPMPPDEPMV